MNATLHRDRVLRLAKSLNCDGRRGLLLLSVCAALLLIQAGGPAAGLLLRYDRAGLAAGQWWRLLTGHVIHLGYEHAVLDICGLVLMWALFARDYSARAWLFIIGLSMLGIDAGLWLLSSTTQWYVGSSGVLHGVLAAGICAHLRRGEPDGWPLALLLIGKLVYEQSLGALPLTAGGPVIVDAHLYGAAAGACAALLLRSLPKPV
ncbi:MAG TPA: rhombosortase [Steroidobacteraceae bacterium]|nr:rhombosortase [Steroidobacteraceae bacterium]